MVIENIFNSENITKTLSISDSNLQAKIYTTFQAQCFLKGFNYYTSTVCSSEAIENTDEFLTKIFGVPYSLRCDISPRKGGTGWIFEPEDNIAFSVLQYSKTSAINISIGSKSFATAQEWISKLKAAMPTPKTKLKPEEVPISFWSYSQDGPYSRNRDIAALDWEEIGPNYPKSVLADLHPLMRIKPPIDGGKIILWHGMPGTGKSSAIRSIAQAWLPWCDFSYIMDPEKFFNVPDYMLEVALDNPSKDHFWDDDDDEDSLEDNFILEGDKRWRLVVIEDADEFIRAEAKEQTGQALSRLLGIGDGLIGQGLNFITLITTNEKINNIHPAVSRPGRCLANIEFKQFTQEEAAIWWGTRMGTAIPRAQDSWTLAQLYDLTRKNQQIVSEKEEVKMGVYL